MKQVISNTRIKEIEKEKIAVVKLEMDYELATLFEAVIEKNDEMIKKCKEKLEKIRLELIRLKAF